MSIFFLNNTKRKFQETKDLEQKKLSVKEVEDKAIKEEREKINENLLLNEHTFLEFFQYKYDKHTDKVNFADDFSRDTIFKKLENLKKDKSHILLISIYVNLIVESEFKKEDLNFEGIIARHIKYDHIKNFSKSKNNCDELKKIIERIKSK